MIWLAAQLWPAALIALVAGFAVTWFTVVQRLDEASADEGRSDATADTERDEIATQAEGGRTRQGSSAADREATRPADDGATRVDAPSTPASDAYDHEAGGEGVREKAATADDHATDARGKSGASGSVGHAFTSRREE